MKEDEVPTLCQMVDGLPNLVSVLIQNCLNVRNVPEETVVGVHSHRTVSVEIVFALFIYGFY